MEIDRGFFAGLQLMVGSILCLVGLFKFFVLDKMKTRSSFCAIMIFGNLLSFSGELMCEDRKMYYLTFYALLFFFWIVVGYVHLKKEQVNSGETSSGPA